MSKKRADRLLLPNTNQLKNGSEVFFSFENMGSCIRVFMSFKLRRCGLKLDRCGQTGSRRTTDGCWTCHWATLNWAIPWGLAATERPSLQSWLGVEVQNTEVISNSGLA